MQRTIERLEGIRDVLVSYIGTERGVSNLEPPSLVVWQLYESMKEGNTPRGIEFYLKLVHPEDFRNPLFGKVLSSAIEEAEKIYITGHLVKYEINKTKFEKD